LKTPFLKKNENPEFQKITGWNRWLDTSEKRPKIPLSKEAKKPFENHTPNTPFRRAFYSSKATCIFLNSMDLFFTNLQKNAAFLFIKITDSFNFITFGI
jgi:hypothetical protein